MKSTELLITLLIPTVVLSVPNLHQSPSPSYEKDEVKMICDVTDVSTPPTFEWEVNGALFIVLFPACTYFGATQSYSPNCSSSGTTYTMEMVISSASSNDNGKTWVCRALGSDSTSVTAVILQAPTTTAPTTTAKIPSDGLEVGTIVGIVIGVIVAITVVVLVILYFTGYLAIWWRKWFGTPDDQVVLNGISNSVPIPQEDYPDIKFEEVLTHSFLNGVEQETGVKVMIYGKGSSKYGQYGDPKLHSDQPLHVYITSDKPKDVKKALDMIKGTIDDYIAAAAADGPKHSS